MSVPLIPKDASRGRSNHLSTELVEKLGQNSLETNQTGFPSVVSTNVSCESRICTLRCGFTVVHVCIVGPVKRYFSTGI